MDLKEQYEKIHLEVLHRIKPKKKEHSLLSEKYNELKEKIAKALTKAKIEATIELTGSFSRDTWLSGTRDIDVFIILPYTSKTKPKQVLDAVKKEIKLDWLKKHAKHPYLFSYYDGIQIEIIPCYEFNEGRELRSPVDRTPAHKVFIEKNMPVGVNDEVRLLKRFLRGIGVYGAEIKVHGFSGYLVELLILKYNGSFLEVLKNAVSLTGKTITFSKNIPVNEDKLKDDVLIVIDPTDKNRNVASPLNKKSLDTFIAAATRYLRKPSLVYFFPKRPILTEEKINEMRSHPLTYSAIIFNNPRISDDIIWGQIRKFEKSLKQVLSNEEISIVSIDSIVVDEIIVTLIITTDEKSSPMIWHSGPPITNEKEEIFLRKYNQHKDVILGPMISNEARWKILLKRESLRIDKLLFEILNSNIITKPSHLSIKDCQILFKEDFIDYIKEKEKILEYLAILLAGKPSYLC